MKIEGKVALITGSAGGIGRGYCEALLEKGAKAVSIVDIKFELGEETAFQLCTRFGAGKALFIKTDVTNETELRAAFKKTLEEYGRLDIVSCTAGVLDEINYKLMVDINLVSVISGTYLAYEHMKDGGVVVHTASAAGLQTCPLFMEAYCATKFGVVGFVKTTSQVATTPNVQGSGVRVNAVCPYFVDTGLLTDMKLRPQLEKQGIDEITEWRKNTAETLTPADVASAFIRLVEDDSLNGVCVEVKTNEHVDHRNTPFEHQNEEKK